MVDPPAQHPQLGGRHLRLAVGRHVHVIVERQFNQFDDVTLRRIAGLEARTFQTTFDKQLIGIHAVVALTFFSVVTRHTAPF